MKDNATPKAIHPSIKQTIRKLKHFLSFLVMLAAWSIAMAQTPYVWVKGIVVDNVTGKGIPYAQIASFTTYTIYATDSVGRFNVSLPGNDSIRVLAMGFAPRNVWLTNQMSTPYLTIELMENGYELDEVIVYNKTANEHLQKYMPSYMKMGYSNPVPVNLRNDFYGKPTVGQALKSPTSFLYYLFSKTEKRKRIANKALAAEKAQARMTKDLVAELTGLEPPDLDGFYVYCNANIKIASNHADSFIRARILDAYVKYTGKNKADGNKDVEK